MENILANYKEYGRAYIRLGSEEYSKLIFQSVDESWTPRIIMSGSNEKWLINPVGNTIVSRQIRGVIPKEYLEDFVYNWKNKYCASEITKNTRNSLMISYKNIMLDKCYLMSLEVVESVGKIPSFAMGIVSEKETFNDETTGTLPLGEYEINRDMMSYEKKAIIVGGVDDNFETFTLMGVRRLYKDRVSLIEMEDNNIRMMAFGLYPCKYTLTLTVPEYVDNTSPSTTLIKNLKDRWLVRKGGDLVTVNYGKKTIRGAVISVNGRNTIKGAINIIIEMVISQEIQQ